MDKSRKRDIEEYNYNLKITRRQEQEAFDAKVRERNLIEVQRQRALEQSWAEREETLSKQEAEMAEAKEKIAKFDETLQAEVKKQVAIESARINRDHKVELEKLQLQTSASESLMAQEIANLKVSLAEKTSTIASLQGELTQSKQEIAKLATEAMQAASGRQALAAVESFAEKSGSSKK